MRIYYSERYDRCDENPAAFPKIKFQARAIIPFQP